MNTISSERLLNQQITSSRFTNVQDLVAWMGAMQAQDFNMLKWAVGLRLPLATEKTFDDAFASGEIIRTHLLRPTWHLVSANDVRWMLGLTAPRIRASLKTRLKQLEIDETLVLKVKSLLGKNLAGHHHLTREAIALLLENEGITAVNLRLSHLLMVCELDEFICSGAPEGKKQTYALLDERVPQKNKISKEESLEKLSSRYFSSHGPATERDFAWWSGLSLKDIREALRMTDDKLISFETEHQVYWAAKTGRKSEASDAAFLVPAYDEFIISYTDRTDSLLAGHHPKAISNNGVFRPTVVINGQVKGLWKKVVRQKKTEVGFEWFIPLSKPEKGWIEKAKDQYFRFYA